MAGGGVHVPDELTEDILLRVPVKSLVRFKAASRKWHSLLSDPKFADFHLKRSSSSENRIIFQRDTAEKPTFVSMSIDTNESRIFNLPVEIPSSYSELIGSVNGLVCVAPPFVKGGFFIWNPCTGQSKKIYVSVPKAADRLCGFGYDSYSDDYKVVGDWGNHFRVFSLKSNSWKLLDYCFPMLTNALHFNDALHWCVGRYVVAFDFATEQLRWMIMPLQLERTYIQYPDNDVAITVKAFQGLLCASGGNYICVMKKYGKIATWAKLKSMPLEDARPVAVSRLGEVVYLRDDRSGIIKSDLQGKVSDEFISQMTNLAPVNNFAYIESLISPMRFDSQPESKKMTKRPRKQRKIN